MWTRGDHDPPLCVLGGDRGQHPLHPGLRPRDQPRQRGQRLQPPVVIQLGRVDRQKEDRQKEIVSNNATAS